MKLALLTGVGLLGLSATPGLLAQTPRPLWPEVDAVFQGFTKPGSPGCSVAMAVRDSVIYRQGYGLAVIEWDAGAVGLQRLRMAQAAAQAVDAGAIARVQTDPVQIREAVAAAREAAIAAALSTVR